MDLKRFVSGSANRASLSWDWTHRLSVTKDACTEADFDCISFMVF